MANLWDELDDDTAESRAAKGLKQIAQATLDSGPMPKAGSEEFASGKAEPSADLMDIIPVEKAALTGAAGAAKVASLIKGAALAKAGASKPALGALALGAIKSVAKDEAKELPMDLASRMARAKEMNLDTNDVFFHTTDKNIEEFIPSKDGSYGPGVYAYKNAPHKSGNIIVNETGANVIPFYVRGKTLDLNSPERDALWDEYISIGKKTNKPPYKSFGQFVQERGYAGMGEGDERVIFDPKNIRSVYAKFDPAQASSSKITAGLGGAALLGGASASSQDAQAAEPEVALQSAMQHEAFNDELQKVLQDRPDLIPVAKKIGLIGD